MRIHAKAPHSCESPSAARPCAGRAAKAVAVRPDAPSGQTREAVEFPNRESWRSRYGCHAKSEHLVEITVIELPVPSHADQRAAHKIGHGSGIEMIDEQAHVRVVLPIQL